MRLAFIAFAKRFAWYLLACHRIRGNIAHLIRDFLLFLPRKVDKVVVLCADQERDGSLIETSSLAVPLFDRVERALAREVKHEEDGDGVIAD
jgi:hypothetical protein